MATATPMSDVEKFVQEELMKSIMHEEVKKAGIDKKLDLKPKARKALAGQKMYSDVFGYKPVSVIDFPVTILISKDIPVAIAALVPDATDPELQDYVPQQEQLEQLVFSWENHEKVLISGPTGSGKSSMVKFACQKLNRPFVRVNMNGDIESSALFGQLVVEDGGTVWKDGAVTEAIKFGGVVCIDEWEVSPPEITMSMQSVLERGGILFLKEKPGTSFDKMVKPHDNTRFVFCGNTVGQGDDSGQFAGTNVQNTATIDRFDTAIYLDYLSQDHETAIVKSKVPDIDDQIVKLMLQYAALIRAAYKQTNIGLTMSPRTLINWARKTVNYGSYKTALNYCFVNKLRDGDKKVAQEVFTKVFGK